MSSAAACMQTPFDDCGTVQAPGPPLMICKLFVPVKPPTRLFSSGKVHFVVERLVVQGLGFSTGLAIGPLPEERQ